MKYIRILSIYLLWGLALIAFLGIAAISPLVQTWCAERALARHPDLHGSLSGFTARFGTAKITDLHLEKEGAILTAPSIKASLPITTALWEKKFQIQRLTAKGWTLDLSHRTAPPLAQSQSSPRPENGNEAIASSLTKDSPAQLCLQLFHRILSDWKLPCDVSLDGVELEGDILFTTGQGDSSSRMHVIIRGGGITAGRTGSLTMDVTGQFIDSKLQMSFLKANGHLIVSMDSAQSLNLIGVKSELLLKSDLLKRDLNWAIDASVARGVGDESYSLELSHDSKQLITLAARVASATGRPTGTWKIDLRESDLAPFISELPSFTAVGEGAIITDSALTRAHAAGHLKIVAKDLGVLSPPLTSLGSVSLDADFNLIHTGHSLRFEQLSMSLSGAQPIASLQSLQPFVCDELSGQISVPDFRKDWLEASITSFPLDCFSGLLGDITLSGGNAAGVLGLQISDGTISLRSKTPFTAKAVSVQRAGKVIGQNLDLSLSFLADRRPQGWQLQWSPLVIESAGQALATLDGKALRPMKADQTTSITSTWKADLKALTARSVIPGSDWMTAHSASGEFTANVGVRSDVEGNMTVLGPKADQAIATNFHLDIGANGGVSFRGPITISLGSDASELSAVGTWSKGEAGNQIAARLTGKKSSLGHLQQLLAPLAALGGAPLSGNLATTAGERPPLASKRDILPFWGDWFGYITVSFDQLQMGGTELKAVRGAFNFDHRLLSLDNGTSELPDHTLAMAKGSISFDPRAEVPYTLKATAELGEVDGAPAFGPAPKGKDPVFHGRFSVVRTLRGNGITLSDLWSRTEDEFKLTSKGGIIRFLKANIVEALPEQPSKAGSEILGTMGDAVGAIFGTQKPSVAARRIRPSANTEAVLNFSYDIAEFRYDLLTLTATRGADKNFRLTGIELTGPDEHITGSGQITHAEGTPLSAQPLSAELKFGFRGRAVKYLTTAGLLSAETDDKGYAILKQPVRFGGTLQKIDKSEWHELLIKAAAPKPDEKKKTDTAGSGGK